jgi:hypothetical protein
MPAWISRAGRGRAVGLAVSIVAIAVVLHGAEQPPPWKSGIEWPMPKVVDPGPPAGPPADAIVLFDGKDLSQWTGGEKWIIKDGYGVCQSEITTKRPFGDCQLHVEWATPAEAKGQGQGRGNSGVYLMGLYELQILDSYENETYFDGQAGSIYKQRPPLVNASRKPGEWQSYDIVFKAPRFSSDGKLLKPAYITALHNGVLILNHFEIVGETAYRRPPKYNAHPPKLPLQIQFHGSPLKFRNIWIRELEDEREDLLTPLREKVKAAAAAAS